MRGRALATLALAALIAAPAAAQPPALHGESAIFVGPGLTIAWAVLRAPVDDQTEVVLRIVASGGGDPRLDVDAVDPFTGARRGVVAGLPADGPVEVRMPRAGFGDLPRREIRLFRGGRPALTVYYLGVPDTTPEFASEPALRRYLDDAVTGLPRGGHREADLRGREEIALAP